MMIVMMVMIIIPSCKIRQRGLLNHNLGIVVAAKRDMIKFHMDYMGIRQNDDKYH